MRTKEWLKEQRTICNLSQSELCNLANIKLQTLQQIESGRRNGSEEIWKKIERVFNNNQKSEIEIAFEVGSSYGKKIKRNIKPLADCSGNIDNKEIILATIGKILCFVYEETKSFPHILFEAGNYVLLKNDIKSAQDIIQAFLLGLADANIKESKKN